MVKKWKLTTIHIAELCHTAPQRIKEINWDEFVSHNNEDIRDGMKPEDYVRALRKFDRGEIIL